ncbi:MAG: ABC transporter permease [Oscillospiraceae bacterium]|nr:ABC transporter permease [Oscillospiraceae bacterium]
MLIFTLKKMLRGKWMVFCLLIGCVIFVAVLSSIPTYTDGIFQHMLLKDLEAQQVRQASYPGVYTFQFVYKNFSSDTDSEHANARWFAQRFEDRYLPDIGLPLLARRKQYALDRFYYFRRPAGGRLQVNLVALEGFEDHVELVAGRLPQSDPSVDLMEFVMSRADYQRSDISLDVPFDIHSYAIDGDDKLYGQAVLVGVYAPIVEDPYWYSVTGMSYPTFVIDYDYLTKRYVETESIFARSLLFYYCFDYSAIRIENVRELLAAIRMQKTETFGHGTIIFDIERTLGQYLERRDFLSFMLWILSVPVILMLVFYIYMVSRLMMDHESNEIAVLKSRGARGSQIFLVYALESALIAGAAFITGPPLGLLMCRVLGLSNGFMEFVGRRGMPLRLTAQSYFYAAVAAAGFMLVMLIPAVMASRDTIVESKRKRGRRSSVPLWQKLFLDILLLALSLYGLNLYNTNAQMRQLANVTGVDAPLDPIMLAASSLFVLGLGLFFLRVFPPVIALIFRLGKPFWPPTVYTALLSIARFRGGGQFLSLFLVFNIGLGMFSATTARTLNRFLEGRIRYDTGADVVITQSWQVDTVWITAEISDDMEVTFTESRVNPYGPMGQAPDNDFVRVRTQVREPPYDVFHRLEGAEDSTKVFKKQYARLASGRGDHAVEVMGIIPHEFGRIAWTRRDLLPTHIGNYMNLMTADPSAVLLSASMRDDLGIRVGDHVRIGWREQSANLDGTVYGFVDYWPSINPHSADGRARSHFVIANLDSIHRQMRMEPYSVWIKMGEGATSAALYDSIIAEDMRLARIRDTSQELIAVKNDPLLQGLNGTLTLGFVVTLGVTFIGFLIYWVLSIRSRLLQFGILRAMGLSRAGLISTLAWEQLLVSGGAVAAGIAAGGLAGRLFVPTLQLMYTVAEQVPPFLTTANSSDYAALSFALAGMLISGLAVLAVTVRSMKVDQVLKLGED